MTVRLARKNRARFAGWVLLSAFAVAITAGGARAQEDELDDHVLNADKRLFNSILGAIGLRSSPAEDIEYRERSPLVVPPRRDLPPPESTLTEKNPAWPVDPEVKMKREAAAARKSGKESLLRDAGKPVSGTGQLDARGVSRDYPEGRDKMRDEPSFFSMLFKGQLWGSSEDEIAKFKEEPPRTTLTEPPAGYQTPSPAAPYGVSKRYYEVEKSQAPK